MAHTPGPYALKQESIERDWQILTAPGGRIIANVHIGNEIDMANARLIAAAPELLEALKVCAQFIVDCDGLASDEYSRASAAIAKATGAP